MFDEDADEVLDADDMKDRLFHEWLYKARRTLKRLPEYSWLFSDGTPDWWTVDQVAERLAVSKKTVYGWCAHIIGARAAEGKAGYRIPRSGLTIFLADQEQEETGSANEPRVTVAAAVPQLRAAAPLQDHEDDAVGRTADAAEPADGSADGDPAEGATPQDGVVQPLVRRRPRHTATRG